MLLAMKYEPQVPQPQVPHVYPGGYVSASS